MCHILDAKPSPWTLAKTRKEFWFTRQRPLSIPQLRNGKESAGRKWRFKGWSNIKLTFTDGWQSAPSESRRASYPHCPRMQKWAHHPPSAGVTHHGPLSLSALNPLLQKDPPGKGLRSGEEKEETDSETRHQAILCPHELFFNRQEALLANYICGSWLQMWIRMTKDVLEYSTSTDSSFLWRLKQDILTQLVRDPDTLPGLRAPGTASFSECVCI